MTELEKEVKEFLKSEDNIYGMELKKIEKETLFFQIVDSQFKVEISGPGIFKISSKDELLGEIFVKECNSYCKQGKKKVKDVLIKVTEVFSSILGEDNNEGDQEIIEEGIIEDDFSFSEVKKPEKPSLFTQLEKLEGKFVFDKNASKNAIDRLLKDYIELCQTDNKVNGWKMNPIQGDIFRWEIQFFDFDKDIFNNDLKEYAKKHNGQDYVKLEMKFPNEYPYKPPFIRVVSPRFAFRTGRVTVGGSICFELLTGSGWKPINSLESILLQIKLEMTNGLPRIDFGNGNEYGEKEAREAFFRVANDHKWDTTGL